MFSKSSTSIGKRALATLLLVLFLFFSFALATSSVAVVFQCNCVNCSCAPGECNCESEVEEQTLIESALSTVPFMKIELVQSRERASNSECSRRFVDCLINCFHLQIFERTYCTTTNMVSEVMELCFKDEAVSCYALFIEQLTPITSKIRMNN